MKQGAHRAQSKSKSGTAQTASRVELHSHFHQHTHVQTGPSSPSVKSNELKRGIRRPGHGDDSRTRKDVTKAKKAEPQDVTCSYCHHKGHHISNCHQLQLKQAKKAEPQDVTCSYCHRKGHHISNCHQVKREKKAESGSDQSQPNPTILMGASPVVAVYVNMPPQQAQAAKCHTTKPKGYNPLTGSSGGASYRPSRSSGSRGGG